MTHSKHLGCRSSGTLISARRIDGSQLHDWNCQGSIASALLGAFGSPTNGIGGSGTCIGGALRISPTTVVRLSPIVAMGLVLHGFVNIAGLLCVGGGAFFAAGSGGAGTFCVKTRAGSSRGFMHSKGQQCLTHSQHHTLRLRGLHCGNCMAQCRILTRLEMFLLCITAQ